MKDIKSYIIGFLSCACMFLFIGATDNKSEIGRYDIESIKDDFVIVADTKTGEIVKFGFASHPMELQNTWRKRLTKKPDNFNFKWWTDLDEIIDDK